MSITNEIRPRLLGTLLNIFKINTIQLKNNTESISFRNESDTSYIDADIKRLKVYGNNSTNPVILDAPDGLTDGFVLKLPDSDGYSGQVLQTNGSGELSFGNAQTVTTTASSASSFDKDVNELLRTNS